MSLYFNGATNFITVNMNGSEVNLIYANAAVVYSKAWVTFNEQGGSGVGDRFVWYGRTYGQYAPLPTPSRSGFTFGGWFTGTLGSGSQITASTVKTSTGTTQTLYAYWISAAVPTATPTIVNWNYFNAWYINIRNNDTGSADIRSEANDSTPDILRGTAGAGATLQVFDNSQPGFATFTYYATAIRSDGSKTLSAVTSRTIT